MSFSFFFHKNGVTVPALHFSEACVEMFKEQLSIQTLFQTRATLIPICVLPAIDCELTEWSQWSECNKSCGKGHMIRTRMIQMEPQFGGAPCPETVQRKKCRIRKCLRNPSLQNLRWREARESRRSEQLREESDGDQFPGTAPKCGLAFREMSKQYGSCRSLLVKEGCFKGAGVVIAKARRNPRTRYVQVVSGL